MIQEDQEMQKLTRAKQEQAKLDMQVSKHERLAMREK